MIVIMVHICKIIIFPGVLFFCLFICLFFFFHFFKILILSTVSRVKGHKMTQNDKKNCLLCPLSWDPSIIWLSFIVHMFKVIISPGIFFIFSKVWFSRLSGWQWKDNKWSKMTKTSVCRTLYSRNNTSSDLH